MSSHDPGHLLGPRAVYPAGLEERIAHGGRSLLVRPIRPEDAPRHREFLKAITPQDLYTRFFIGVHELPDADLAHLTQIDYEREMAFVATVAEGSDAGAILGVSRACVEPDGTRAEFAVLVRSDLKGRGLGTLLMRKLIAWCRARGVRRLGGLVLCDNGPMLRLARALGFTVRGAEGNLVEVSLDPAAVPQGVPQAGAAAPRQTTLE